VIGERFVETFLRTRWMSRY